MFPPTHQRYLFSRFHHIDETLGEAVQALGSADEGRLYKAIVPDATALQRKILLDYLAQLRFSLRTFAEAHQLQDRSRAVSGLWAVRTAVIFAQTAVAELRPAYLKGYGPLDGEAVAASERLVAELTTLLKRIGNYLDRGEQGDLASRLKQLDSTRAEIALLLELERVITEHGLVEMRTPLEALVERAAVPRYEIAVFGRVNSGKSSLLNWWLGQPVLPTGVTPVTAVPTRIVPGERARARVRMGSSASIDIALGQLAEYVTETGNPGNSRHVLEIVVEVTGSRLAPGIVLVDTPGLGSLAAAGAVQTLEYLPRCDLGIQLIEAGGVLTPEDLAVARAVLDSGSDLLIALSKSDRLSEADLRQATAYVENAVSSDLGVEVPVRPVSTVVEHEQLIARWFEEEIAPRLVTYREQAAALLKRKIGVLREGVSAVLAARLSGGSPHQIADSGQRPRWVDERVAQMRADLERARSSLLTNADGVGRCGQWLMRRLAEELVRVWTKPDAGLPADQALRRAVALRAAEIGDLIAQGLKDCENKLQHVLAAMGSNSEDAQEYPQPRGRPVYDVDAVPSLTTRAPPRWAFFSRSILLRAAERRIQTQLQAALSEQLSLYSDALRLWGNRYLEELSQYFQTVLAADEGIRRSRAAAPLDASAAGAIRRDLDLLEQWPRAHGDSPSREVSNTQH